MENTMLAPVTHILPLAAIRRKRMLPIKGSVLVRAGQKVAATDVIAEANLTPEHVVLDVARGLGVAPHKAAGYIQRKIGDEITKDSIVASRRGLVSRTVRSPHAGHLVAISDGQVLIEVKNQPYQLKAGLPGEILSVEAEFGGVVETAGAWIQGVWGNGKINYGLLNVFAKEPGHIFSAGEMNVNHRGSIILAGHCNQPKALEAAADVPIRGLILASMAPKLAALAIKMPYPIIIIEGFGELEMNSAAYTLLSTNATRETTINAETLNRYEDKRPEIIIPLEGSGNPPIPLSIENFKPGQTVRVLRSPHIGAIGTIQSLLPGLTRLPSGLRAPSVNIELEGGEKMVIPLATIDVLG
jgi:hypothetical protein